MIRWRSLSTIRHADLAMFQSAVHEVSSRQAPHSLGEHPAMHAVVAAAHRVFGTRAGPSSGLPRSELFNQCAELCIRYVLALAEGRHAQAAVLRSELQYASCDPLWIETVLTYEHFRERRGVMPYVRHEHLDDFVLAPLPDAVRIALIADWGTGTPAAQALLEQIAHLEPDVIIHLGDIYYSATPHEVRRHFLDVVDRVFPTGRPRLYALSGNHDRYSGGHGYSLLLEQLGQPASYFCLRTAHWQLLAMDTGLHDHDPGKARARMTYLEPSEVEWLRHQLAARPSSILLSHHPYFSWDSTGIDDEGNRQAVNLHLAEALGAYLPSVAWWFWGHEHNLLVYEPWANLARGRCIGAGAIPRLVGEQRNAPRPKLVLPAGESAPPSVLAGTRLENDGVVDNHAFALLELDGPLATTHYFQVPVRELTPGRQLPDLRPCFSETAYAERADDHRESRW
jgi:hypothetical protein